MRKITIVALSALLLTALAAPIAAFAAEPSQACFSPPVTVTCVRAENQNAFPSGPDQFQPTSEQGVVMMTCTLRLDTQSMRVDWGWDASISGGGDGVQFQAFCYP